ncbi:MAG: hypothetical protein AUH16_11605 [Acidobacteria bacterium 13_2_20CM_57_7]|nr:MAG: hypothetical protein AUH16_11605 [Acidobacteria bacterium 13_2_20CM_57_7]
MPWSRWQKRGYFRKVPRDLSLLAGMRTTPNHDRMTLSEAIVVGLGENDKRNESMHSIEI